jgi:hypothetical protein
MSYTPTTALPTAPTFAGDPNDLLRRIEANTASAAQWARYATVVLVILAVLFALAFLP